MTKTELATTYYKAWEAKDSKVISSLFEVHPIIRTYQKELIFNQNQLNQSLAHVQGNYHILKQEESDEIIYLEVMNNDIYLDVKMVIVDGFLHKVFETIKLDTTRIKCVVSYDGSNYAGFQRQKNERTVQGDIEKGLFHLTKENITIHSSGRTDKGVHATNQVFHFDTKSTIEPRKFAYVLKSYLPDSIYVTSSEKVPNTFHSRYDVKTKEYVYKINKGKYNPIMREYEWHVEGVNIELFRQELISIVGTHDFCSFTKSKEEKDTIRTIYDIQLVETSDHLYVHMIGNGFLRYMVRYLVGTAVEIAKGKVNTTLRELLDQQDPSEVRWIAPGCGLYLEEVTYYE